MKLDRSAVEAVNKSHLARHKRDFAYTAEKLSAQGFNIDSLVKKIGAFQVATPSWAMGTGGTRFGRFPGIGEPATLEQKIEDAHVLHVLCNQTNSISLHIPWDIPKDPRAIRQLAQSLEIKFDAVNSNTFQDAKEFANAPRKLSYKFGSLCHNDRNVRAQAVEHNIECIEYGKALGSKAITVWLADGTTFPGQANFRRQFNWVADSLKAIYKHLPSDWYMFTEHKPYEPNFYSSVVNDWGSSLLLAQAAGPKCLCLVDLGHHLPNANIEQVVSRLLMVGRLAGFHFNDSKYSDDDLTVGCLKSYQLFLIFNELVEFLEGSKEIKNPAPAWMIDASHNVKDPLEDLLQSFEAIALAYAQALLIPRKALEVAQAANDVALCQELLQTAYRTDVRPLIAEARIRNRSALQPIDAFRRLKIRSGLAKERGTDSVSSGL